VLVAITLFLTKPVCVKFDGRPDPGVIEGVRMVDGKLVFTVSFDDETPTLDDIMLEELIFCD